MFKKGDAVIYGSQVYIVEGTTQKTIGKVTRDYYALKNAYDEKNTAFIPTDNEKLLSKMRHILSREQILEMISEFPNAKSIWVEDDKERSASFRAILEKGDRREIAQLVKTLFEMKKALSEKGRRLHTADEAIFLRAEKVICEEFALVLNIKPDEVIPFIGEQLK